MAPAEVISHHSPSPSLEDSGADQTVDDMATNQKVEKPKSQSASANSKDPSRPRRKKARRACYACQRAHLTCGDERPCQRCIKRGLQDACQDGVRKKAKYLHDAPNEALMPGIGVGAYNRPTNKRNSSSNQTETSPIQQQSQLSQQQQQQQQNQFISATQPFNVFPPATQMPPPLIHERSMSQTNFAQQSPINSTFSLNSQAPLQSPVIGSDQNSVPGMNSTRWNGALFDDSSLINFDLASMNFGNHYGALEFGMLGHMATNAGETPPSDTATQRGSIHQPFRVPIGSFSEGSGTSQFNYNDAMITDWSNGTGVYHPHLHGKMNGPNAFTIETNTGQFTSPDTNNATPDGFRFDDSPMMTSSILKNSSDPSGNFNPNNLSPHARTRQPPPISTPQLKARSQLPVKAVKRPRDPSSIYTTVTSPHPYTAGFHALVAYLQKRFSNTPSKTLNIARSLASIRPSFIATTKTLNREDLIFMEKCFQRTLWEYEGFIEGVGTPTIVARRTGEVAAVGKEFQILTGWTKSVLLGRTPNLNVNRGHTGTTPSGTGSGVNTASRATGWNTPTQRIGAELENGEKRQQPVFLAELLDDDSVVSFYEDFARLAFGDSRGSVMGRAKLLKYRTKDDEITQNLQKEAESRGEISEISTESKPDFKRGDSTKSELKKEGISGEKGMQRLGSADGKVDCTYCWTVKRDVFDIPMLIVMNFLPCI